ncbi:HD-GYP domain-containing protein [Crenobacter cavernae]|uniref:HD domain-containing protein n=1 Tax=Crenobacter cavernae TaxID=2290923 RepID=A0A345Y3Y0_9NEIS|nr:HD domain-containing phosphohydrolase [Crenobacter cavernae]AXK38632.1 HD domain-containing protein [Crenobacter cavernae]
MGNDIRLELPDNLFVRHRLHQEGALHFRLDKKFRQVLIAPHPAGAEPQLPERSPFALWETSALVSYYSQLIPTFAGGRLRAEQLTLLCERLAASARQSRDGVVAAILLCPWQNYVAHHAVNTALLACQLADALKLCAEEHRVLMLAALAMNLGSIALHNEMARQEGPPSTSQRQLIDIHPFVGSALLREAGLDDERLHRIVLMHHERHDGHGYPFRLKGDEIDPLAHLLHVLDVTTAKLMPRSYRPRIPAQRALAQLYTNANEKFDPRYTTQLVKALGVYPSGSFVKLESGETAIVVAQTDHLHEPQVATLRSRYDLIASATPGQRIAKSVTVKVDERHLSKLAPFWGLQ